MREIAALKMRTDAGSEVLRRAGSTNRQTRLFGVPQSRRLGCARCDDCRVIR
jgi:hypothetical protein